MIANATANRKIAHLVEFAGFSLTAISDFSKYFKALQANIENYIIAIAVKDTPGLYFTDALYADMQRIGVTVNLTKKHWYGYAAIIDGGNLLAEDAAYQKVVTVKAKTKRWCCCCFHEQTAQGRQCNCHFFQWCWRICLPPWY